jgi:hypothetical protein
MRKILVALQMSVDGFIEGPAGRSGKVSLAYNVQS